MNYGISWKCIPQSSPCMGDACKSIEKLTKTTLKIVIHAHQVSQTTFFNNMRQQHSSLKSKQFRIAE